jgi:hypothetical protein
MSVSCCIYESHLKGNNVDKVAVSSGELKDNFSSFADSIGFRRDRIRERIRERVIQTERNEEKREIV